MMHLLSQEFDLNVLFIHLRTRKTLFDVLFCTLRSKVNLTWTRAIEPVIAQSAQFGEIAFNQLHFNNVTSGALFYVGHFVMRSKRCEVKN